MELFEHIVADHREISRLMKQLLEINLATVQVELFSQIRAELSRHAAAEEATLYTALKAAPAEAHVESSIGESYGDHDEMRVLMDALSREGIQSAMWMELFGELRHAAEHHFRHEETVLFPDARSLFTADQAAQLGEDYARIRADYVVTKTPEAETLHT